MYRQRKVIWRLLSNANSHYPKAVPWVPCVLMLQATKQKSLNSDTEGIEYAIRAKTSAAMRAQIAAVNASDWMPFLDKKGEAVSGQDTYRTSFCIGEYEKPFTLIIQRTAVIGQTSLDLGSPDSSYGISSGEINSGAYIYRAIATNRPLVGMG